MLNKKSILSFSIIFIGVYLLLILPFSEMNKVYADFYRKQATFFFENIGKSGYIMFDAKEEPGNDVVIRQTNKSLADANGNVASQVYNISSKTLAYLPTVLMVALFAATPVKLMRRLLLLLAGLAMLQLFLMLSLYIIIIYHYAHTPWLKLYQSANGSTYFIDFLNGITENGTGLNSFLVLFIWIGLLLLFEKESLRNLRDKMIIHKINSMPMRK